MVPVQMMMWMMNSIMFSDLEKLRYVTNPEKRVNWEIAMTKYPLN